MRSRGTRSSIGEAEMHHIAVGDDIVLAFEPHLAGLFGRNLAAEPVIVRIRDRLGADEALLEIGMDDARGLRRLGAARNVPGARLLRARR